jgi:hypothetical protein
MKSSKKPLVYIIILNWNGKKHLSYCLPSVVKTDYSNLRIVVADNGSTDGSQAFVHRFKNVELIENKKNMGFAAGNNAGIKYALDEGAKYIVLLNNDTLVDKDWISVAVKCAEKDEKIGMLGFNLFGAEKPADINDFYKAIKKKTKSFKYSEDYVCGCAMFVTRFLIEKIGIMDPIYFIYDEEIDWGKRAKRAGFKIAYVDVPIYHNLASTTKKIFLKTSFLQIRNTIRCSIKNDNIFQILRRFLAVINTACNPFKKIDKENAIFVRLRPFNPLINLIVIVNAFAWNFLFLPQTLYARSKRFQNFNKINSIKC